MARPGLVSAHEVELQSEEVSFRIEVVVKKLVAVRLVGEKGHGHRFADLVLNVNYFSPSTTTIIPHPLLLIS